MISKISKPIILINILILINVVNAYPWGSTGHRIINLKAVMYLPKSMSMLAADSLFFRAHASDADGRKDYSDTAFFAEAGRHYIDIDYYPSYLNLPHTRDSAVALYGWGYVKQQGVLPWAITMVLDSLTAQLRRWDTVTAKYTMSDLGHYVGDGYQPLHCTANYDGAQTGNNGIHSRYESSMIGTYQSYLTFVPDSASYISSPIDYIFSFIYHSNSLVDSIMAADDYAKIISGWTGSGSPPANYYTALWEKCGTFTEEQFQNATVALASLWYTAWVNSGNTTAIQEFAGQTPNNFRLENNYPQPFNPSTSIGFEIPRECNVQIKVYNPLGQEILTLVNNEFNAGKYKVEFNAINLPSGLYFYRIVAGEFTQTKKMMLLK
jgi:hypothetical protein